jgi:hypothetical protein
MQSILIAAAAGIVAAGAAWADPADPVIVPFDLSSGRPVVDVMINGEGPFPFVFDTGATGAMIRSSLVAELGLEITGTGRVGSPAGGEPIAVEYTRLDRASLGGAASEDIRAIIVDFGDPRQMASVGVIGPNIFADYGRVAFDFTENQVEIGGALHHDDSADWQDFSATAPIIEIPLTIGDVTVPVHIDTGNPSILNFPEDRIEDLPLAGPLQVMGEARTIDRVMEIRGAPIAETARVGDAEIPLRSVTSFPLPFANMGSGALRDLYLEIDWTQERFAISGTAQPADPRRRVVRQAPAND